jgi:LppP/LprE lipoprotein
MLAQLRAIALALAGLAAVVLAGCGSNTTVTATSTVTQTVTASPTTSSTSSSSTAASSTVATVTSTSTATSVTTRTSTAPAFVGPLAGESAELKAAIRHLTAAGYVPVSTSTYHPDDTLRVLIGRRASGAAGELAFFFDQGDYLGTDSTTPSAQISVVSALDAEVVLAYAIYRAGAATPSGLRYVHFELDMGALSHADALPSVSARR